MLAIKHAMHEASSAGLLPRVHYNYDQLDSTCLCLLCAPYWDLYDNVTRARRRAQEFDTVHPQPALRSAGLAREHEHEHERKHQREHEQALVWRQIAQGEANLQLYRSMRRKEAGADHHDIAYCAHLAGMRDKAEAAKTAEASRYEDTAGLAFRRKVVMTERENAQKALLVVSNKRDVFSELSFLVRTKAWRFMFLEWLEGKILDPQFTPERGWIGASDYKTLGSWLEDWHDECSNDDTASVSAYRLLANDDADTADPER